jgi:hypothetical protein
MLAAWDRELAETELENQRTRNAQDCKLLGGHGDTARRSQATAGAKVNGSGGGP